MILNEIGKRSVLTARPTDPLADVTRKMKKENVGAVVVTEDERVVGIVTDRDLALALGLGEATIATPVSEIMTREVKTIWEDQGVFNATQYFQGHQLRRLPVVDRHDKLVGMITLDDLFGLLTRELYNCAQSLEPALGEKV